MSANIRLGDLKGLSPAVEPTRSTELYALNGQNYVFDTRGPKSVFGNRLLLPQVFGDPRHVQGIRLKLRGGDRSFTFTNEAILEWDEPTGGWKYIYLIPNTAAAPYRWTWGYLNELIFFCHPRTGILVYNPDTGFCLPHNGLGVPTEAISIAICNGVLVAIDPVNFSWSAPNDGMNFNPGLAGAGFQAIGDRVSGFPIMVTSYASGCLTWTSGGVMRSEFTGDTFVFRHRALQTEYRPANSFCTCKIDDDTVVILDERGLFQSKGEAPSPFAPLMNEFLQLYIQENQLAVGQNLRVEWDELGRFMYVSVSLSVEDPIYEQAFVHYPNLDKWGQFNEPHYGILPLRIQQSERAADYYGFVDSDGHVRYWKSTGSREDRAGSTDSNLYYPPIQKPVAEADGDESWIMSSSGIVNTFNDLGTTTRAGFYSPGASIPQNPVLTGLDAKLQFGLFRPNGDGASDELSEIIQILVRSIQSGPKDKVVIDFNLIPPGTSNEDYNLETGADSYGFEPINYTNHGLRVIATIDGTTEFLSVKPDLVRFDKASRLYACSVTGLWHIFEVTATEVGEAFHPVTFEITAINGGRLN